jgi:hypothetical protein
MKPNIGPKMGVQWIYTWHSATNACANNSIDSCSALKECQKSTPECSVFDDDAALCSTLATRALLFREQRCPPEKWNIQWFHVQHLHRSGLVSCE